MLAAGSQTHSFVASHNTSSYL